jgi:CheY-like chemotaxis protein
MARRVLVVDDNADAADTLALLIGALGCKPVVAYDGKTALSMARDQRPEVVFLDIGMPQMDGYEVCRQLRACLGASVRIVALTGLGQERDRQRTLLAGFDGHLIKPVALESLREWLACAAGEPEGSPATFSHV